MTATMQLTQAAAALVGLPSEEQRSAAVAHFAQQLADLWTAAGLPMIELAHIAGDLALHTSQGVIESATVLQAERLIFAGWNGGQA